MTAFPNINVSLAAERALQDGEEVEDTLWVGSGRFDGSVVRRQLQHKSHRTGIGGSQHFLQSMRFWESLRFSRGTNARHNNNNNNSDHLEDDDQTHDGLGYGGDTPQSQVTPISRNGQSHMQLSHQHTLREQQLLRANALLSMRCEASRSMRRQRHHGNINNLNPTRMMHWVMDNTHVHDQVNSVKMNKNRRNPFPQFQLPIPFLFSNNSNNATSPQQLQRKNLEIMEQQERELEQEKNYLRAIAAGYPNYQAFTTANNLRLTNEETVRSSSMEMRSSQSTSTTHGHLATTKRNSNSTRTTKHKKKTKKKKKWRLWLPYRKEPIDLVHPSQQHQQQQHSQSLRPLDHNSTSFYSQADADADASPMSRQPAHVQLKQQLARAHRRKTLNRASRHLETHLENEVSFGSASASTPASNFDTASNFDSHNPSNTTTHTNITTIRSNKTNAPQHSSNNSFRSTRNDVHSNQPLLVRHQGTKGLQGKRPRKRSPRRTTTNDAIHPNLALDQFGDEEEEDSEDEHTIRSRARGVTSKTTGASHNNQQQSSSFFVPTHIQMHVPQSRGSILVQQISGLSIDTTMMATTSIPRSITNDSHSSNSNNNHQHGSTRSRNAIGGGIMTKSTCTNLAIGMSRSHDTHTDEETVDGDDDSSSDDNADSNNYYSVQELLNSSNKIETKRTTPHDAVLTGVDTHKRRSIQQQQHQEKRGRDPEGTRFRYWFETSDEEADGNDDKDDGDDDHASHDDSHDSSYFPGIHRVFGGMPNSSSGNAAAAAAATNNNYNPRRGTFLQHRNTMVRLECLEEVEDETDRMDDSWRSRSSHHKHHPYTGRGVDPSFGSSFSNFNDSALLDLHIPSVRNSNTSSTAGRFGSLFSKSSTSQQSQSTSISTIKSSIKSSMTSTPSQRSIYITKRNSNSKNDNRTEQPRRKSVDAPVWDPNKPDDDDDQEEEQDPVKRDSEASNHTEVSQLTPLDFSGSSRQRLQQQQQPPTNRLSSMRKLAQEKVALGDSQTSLDISGLELDESLNNINHNSNSNSNSNTNQRLSNASSTNRHSASLNSLDFNSSNNKDNDNNAQPHDNHRAAAMAQGKTASVSMSALDSRRKRKSLPVTAMGVRQKGIRGGIIAECAQEALLDASRREEEEEELRQRAIQEKSNLVTTTKAPLRRTKTAPEPRRTSSRDAEDKDDDNENKTANNHQRHDWWKDPPGTAARDVENAVAQVWEGSGGGVAAVTNARSNAPEDSGKATLATPPAEDWQDVQQNDNDAMQDAASFCSNLYVVWDEQGKEDPILVVSEGPNFDALGLGQPNGNVGGVDMDARSVVSEPAQMGMFDDSFRANEDTNDQENKQWLMAWDDLALL